LKTSINSEKINNFLEELGKLSLGKDSLILLGGSALCLLGSDRSTLDIDYVGDDLKKTPLDKLLLDIANKMQLDIEAVPIEKFIPISTHDFNNNLHFGSFGEIEVFILNPYIIAMTKLDRGFETDIEDIVFLLGKGIINLQILEQKMNSILHRAKEFDIDSKELHNHWQDLLLQLKNF
jgi:hypothetical protein